MAKSVKQQLQERGVDIGEALDYTRRWGGIQASDHYGFTYFSWDKFYANETGKHSPTGEFYNSSSKTVGEQLLEAVLSKVSQLQAENERLSGEISKYRKLLELKNERANEQQILMTDEILKLCHC